MNALDLLSSRRSIREFTARVPSRAEIETLLDHAVTGPNHRLTQPWRFYVLGPEARRAFGLVLGGPGADSARRRGGIVLVGVFLAAAVALSAYFLPIWTAEIIPYDQWRMRMWLRSWI